MSDKKKEVSELDNKYFKLLRQDVSDFMRVSSEQFDKEGIRILDIAPQDHEGANPYFKKAQIDTLDIDPDSGATYVADLCNTNVDLIPGDYYDVVVCTEVLEHTLQPFHAVEEIRRILKPGGVALVSVPYNFRIHGPLPDCWRFTEHGLRALFAQYEITSLDSLDDEDRFLAPIHYTMVAKKI